MKAKEIQFSLPKIKLNNAIKKVDYTFLNIYNNSFRASQFIFIFFRDWYEK